SFPPILPTCWPAPNRRAPSASPNLHSMASDLRFLILVEGQFGALSSKTANSCIRYTPDRVAAVIDSRFAGQTVHEVLGFGGDIPVVGTLADGLARHPTALLIGVAPQGGRLPDDWRGMIVG